MHGAILILMVLVAVIGLGGPPLGWAESSQEGKFTEDFLNDPANIELGKTVWNKRCKFCHGKTAYPGKAPKLQPSRLSAEFVYGRVTNGFRGMPSFKHEFSEAERKAVAAYVMSPQFSN